MKLKMILSLLIPVFFSIPCLAQNADAVLGMWQSEHGSARIQISKGGDNYNGKIVWLKEENDESGKPKRDKNNPSEALKSQPIVGLEALSDFTYKGDGVWEGGTVYDPRTGKTYDCKLTMGPGGKLEVRAFMGISLIGKTQTWSRVK